jgi:hypothetical protein
MTDQDNNKSRRRGTRPGSIRQVRLRLWWAIQEAAQLLDDPDKDTRMRAISALSTASGVYAKLTEASELEKRIQALEGATERTIRA